MPVYVSLSLSVQYVIPNQYSSSEHNILFKPKLIEKYEICLHKQESFIW